MHLPTGAPVLDPRLLLLDRRHAGRAAHVLPSRRLPLRAPGRLAGAVPGRAADTSRDRLRIVGRAPWWVRNVVVKVLLRLRLRWLAGALFGHGGPYDPY